MEDTETRCCPNCKREIPCVNFTIHSVHCARNIGVCPVCKEPVPHNELEEHHDKLHKLQPCQKCGESVCGTDMEDHIRDSCAHTIKSCRFCELELPRRELPAHENYCGVRTEQCPDCREWVMIKYRQLHIDSNHGFLRLDDDPMPKAVPKKSNVSMPVIAKITNIPSTSSPNTSRLENTLNGYIKNTNEIRSDKRYVNQPSTSEITPSSSRNGEGTSGWKNSAQTNSCNVPKRTNDQPQINTHVATTNKVEKKLGVSRGAVKKRPAPKPPTVLPNPESVRDLPYYSALQRQQDEARKREAQTAYNLSVGLPPVLSAAAKLEKLRKMDALQNRETNVDYKNCLQGRVWKTPEHEVRNTGNVLKRENVRREDFKNLKPMTPQEFMERFNDLQLRKDEETDRRKIADRFSEIKSSLRELRRGLNEVTAPYNSHPSPANSNSDRGTSPVLQNAMQEMQLPCEFCETLVPAEDLVQHQTGCRPDLAQLMTPTCRDATGGSGNGVSSAAGLTSPTTEAAHEDPVIPCEFCTESLPVYLIIDHQFWYVWMSGAELKATDKSSAVIYTDIVNTVQLEERCGREANLLYSD